MVIMEYPTLNMNDDKDKDVIKIKLMRQKIEKEKKEIPMIDSLGIIKTNNLFNF